ncbi:hypothetical protein PC120_g13621 [Phytophthora cactorum]|nr:hypothetical protein PC120_g13621 [Phytophthora cactorum]
MLSTSISNILSTPVLGESARSTECSNHRCRAKIVTNLNNAT